MLVFQLILVAASVGQGADHAPSKLGIFSIGTSGFEPGVQRTAIDALATAAAAIEGFAVVSRSDLDAMLGAERLKDSVGCDDVSCMAEIGAAAGVERIVAGSLSKLDGALVVSLQLINTRYASTENRITMNWHGSSAQLTDLLGAAAERLLIPARDQIAGRLQLSGLPPDARVSVDDAPRAVGTSMIGELAVGPHEVLIEAEGFAPYRLHIIVRHGQQLSQRVVLERMQVQPFYTQWWFWTATAVAAGGVATAAVLLSGGDGKQASGVFVVGALPGGLRGGQR